MWRGGIQLSVVALAAAFTVKALADHGQVADVLPADGGEREEALALAATAGVDRTARAAQLPQEETNSVVGSWHQPVEVTGTKRAAPGKRGTAR
jgi:hypothetical protein